MPDNQSSNVLDRYKIHRYLHCATCLRELDGMDNMISPSDYTQLEVGVNTDGDLVVWCRRHHAPAAMIRNARLSEILLRVAVQPCSHAESHGQGSEHSH